MRRNPCHKRQYTSEAAALAAYDKLRQVRLKRPGFVDKHQHAYRCPTCGLWHLTSVKTFFQEVRR